MIRSEELVYTLAWHPCARNTSKGNVRSNNSPIQHLPLLNRGFYTFINILLLYNTQAINKLINTIEMAKASDAL